MQFSKASKKTSKNADETAKPETGAAGESTVKPRASRTSKTKNEGTETGAAKHRKATVAEPVVESTAPVLARAAAARAAAPAVSASVDNVIATAPASSPEVTKPAAARFVSREEIAKLAHSYWAARGYAHGHADADWLRAERELSKRK